MQVKVGFTDENVFVKCRMKVNLKMQSDFIDIMLSLPNGE